MSDDSIKAEVAVRIENVCRRFETALYRGEQPSIDDFVQRAAAGDQVALREELMRRDRAFRQRQPADIDGRQTSLSTTIDTARRPTS